MFYNYIFLIFKNLKKCITDLPTLLSVPISHEEQQRGPAIHPDITLEGVDAMGVRQDDILDERGLIATQPAEVRDQEYGIADPVHHPVERVGILADEHMVLPPVSPPVRPPLQPLHQLLLHGLVAVRGPRRGRRPGGIGGRRGPDGVDNEAEGGEERHVEEVGLGRVVHAGYRAVARPAAAEVLEEPPLRRVLVPRVAQLLVRQRRGSVRRPRGSPRAHVAADDAVGELGGQIVHVDLDGGGRGGGGRGSGGGGEGMGEAGGGGGGGGEEEEEEGDRECEEEEEERGGAARRHGAGGEGEEGSGVEEEEAAGRGRSRR